MTTMTTRDADDVPRVKALEDKLTANPEIAKLIDELAVGAHDANDLVRAMLQASINRGMNAEMDAHLGYQHTDRYHVPRIAVPGTRNTGTD